MWAVSLIPSTHFFSKSNTYTPPRFRPSHPRLSRRQNDDVYSEEVSGLTSDTNRQQDNQLRGLDVLLALQRATVKKKNKTRKTNDSRREQVDDQDDDVDYTNVKPLRINTAWAGKLDELGKRLEELSDIA